MKIGQVLKQARKDLGKTQVEVCAATGISQTYLSQLEADIKEPSAEMLRKICKYYKLPVAIVVFKATEEKDVDRKKVGAFRTLKPAIDALIEEYFSPKQKTPKTK